MNKCQTCSKPVKGMGVVRCGICVELEQKRNLEHRISTLEAKVRYLEINTGHKG